MLSENCSCSIRCWEGSLVSKIFLSSNMLKELCQLKVWCLPNTCWSSILHQSSHPYRLSLNMDSSVFSPGRSDFMVCISVISVWHILKALKYYQATAGLFEALSKLLIPTKTLEKMTPPKNGFNPALGPDMIICCDRKIQPFTKYGVL